MLELILTDILTDVKIMAQISEKQKKVLAFIRGYIAEKAIAPTLEEIAEAVEIDTRAGALYHLDILQKEGFIRRNKSLGTRIVELVEKLDFTKVPILGVANAGQPLAEATEDRQGFVEIDSTVLKNKGSLFAVKISGDSMNQQYVPNRKSPNSALLKNGNMAIIDKESEVHEGDVVLAVINGGATIKVFRTTKNSIALMPNSSNPIHQPIFIFENEDLFINGKVVLALDIPKLND